MDDKKYWVGFNLIKAGFDLVGAAENTYQLVEGIGSTYQGLTAPRIPGGNAGQALSDVITGINDIRCGFIGIASRIPGLPQKLNNIASILGTCP